MHGKGEEKDDEEEEKRRERGEERREDDRSLRESRLVVSLHQCTAITS